MIKYLIEKEFKQLLRNSFLPRLIFIFPCMIMLLMPWAANLEIKNIRMNIIDNDHSALSRRLVNKITASTYFRTTALPDSYKEGLEAIEAGTADVLLQIPGDFEKDWVNGEAAHVLVAANAVNGTKGGLGSSYLSAIINDYGTELQAESGNIPAAANGNLPRIDILTQNLFNPNLDYKLFMIPALMVMLLTIVPMFASMYDSMNAQLPFVTQILVDLGKVMPYVLPMLIVAVVALAMFWKRNRNKDIIRIKASRQFGGTRLPSGRQHERRKDLPEHDGADGGHRRGLRCHRQNAVQRGPCV